MSLKIVITVLLFSYFLVKLTFAHCPLCVAATGSAIAVARFYGVPDLITGTFVGAFIISIGSWVSRILKNRKHYIPFQQVIITTLSLSLFIMIFLLARLITTLFDEFLIGMLIGLFITYIAFIFNDFLRRRNGNKNYVPFQIILVTITFLLITIFGYYVIGVI